jgi:hypothetical protein
MPAVVGFLGTTAFTVGSSAITYGAILKTALVIASVAHSRAQAQKAKKAARDLQSRLGQGRVGSSQTISTSDPIGPRQIIYGAPRVGGTIIFRHVNGDRRQLYHEVTAIAGHEVTEFVEWYVNDELVTIDGGNNVLGKYAGHLSIYPFYGTANQTAQPQLLANCPDKWTSNHRLRRIAGWYAKYTYSTDIFPGGVPQISCVVKGKKIYDPRSGTTAWSDNSALIAADYLCDSRLGMGFDMFSDIDLDELSASATVCDEAVELVDETTEKRYTTNIVISTDQIHQQGRDDLAEAMAGKIADVGGKWLVLAGYYRSPTITLDESHARGALRIQAGLTVSENCNRVKGVFISPQNSYQPTDFPVVTNSTYLTEDNNVAMWADLELQGTTSPATAQRIAKIYLEKTRQGISLTFPGMLSCYRLQVGDVVKITSTVLGWTEKHFEVMQGELADGGESGIGFDLQLRETASGVYDWNDGEETEVDLAPNTSLPTLFDMDPPENLVILSDSTTKLTQPNGNIIPRIYVTWDAVQDARIQSGGFVRLQYRNVTDDPWKDWGQVTGDFVEEYIDAGVVDGQTYVVRARCERLGVVSDWIYSDPGEAGDTTPPAAPTGFSASGGYRSVYYSWTNPTDPDLDHIEIYFSSTSTPAPSGGTAASDTTSGSDYNHTGLTDSETEYAWVRAVDDDGNKSAWVGPQGATTDAPLSVSVDDTSLSGGEEFDNERPGSIGTDDFGTVSVTGGSSPFEYAYEYVSGDPEILLVASPLYPYIVGGSLPFGTTVGTYTAVWRVKVTDENGSIGYTANITITMEVEGYIN